MQKGDAELGGSGAALLRKLGFKYHGINGSRTAGVYSSQLGLGTTGEVEAAPEERVDAPFSDNGTEGIFDPSQCRDNLVRNLRGIPTIFGVLRQSPCYPAAVLALHSGELPTFETARYYALDVYGCASQFAADVHTLVSAAHVEVHASNVRFEQRECPQWVEVIFPTNGGHPD
ncbi:MAG TPA: hypothetical protein VET25_09305 [Aestuariivirgaceae bacterium]|nr:hypothetical protein [Aestuariivirgaceae bacterium]